MYNKYTSEQYIYNDEFQEYVMFCICLRSILEG